MINFIENKNFLTGRSEPARSLYPGHIYELTQESLCEFL